MDPENLDTMLARHREELGILQDRIAGKKRNATKKTRRGVNDECAELERRLRDKQAGESAALDGDDGGGSDDKDNGEDNRIRNAVLSEQQANAQASQQQKQQQQQPIPNLDNPITAQPKRRNRQKERLARRAAEQEAAVTAAVAEASAMVDHRGLESARMRREMDVHSLVEQPIRPDGHCLFSAVADQLRQQGLEVEEGEEKEESRAGDAGKGKEVTREIGDEEDENNAEAKKINQADREKETLDYKTVRHRAAAYMEAHPDDFAPFIDEPLAGYVAKIRDTAEWGGQIELSALAKAYDVEICVVQDGPTEKITPDGQDGGNRPVVWLAYYRHGYGLGEHYNSLRKSAAAAS